MADKKWICICDHESKEVAEEAIKAHQALDPPNTPREWKIIKEEYIYLETMEPIDRWVLYEYLEV